MEVIYVPIFHSHAVAHPPISLPHSRLPSDESENFVLNSRFFSIVNITFCRIAISSRYASSPIFAQFCATSSSSRYAAEYGIKPNAYLPNVGSPWFNTFPTCVGANVTRLSCNNSAALHLTLLSKSSFKSSRTIGKMPSFSVTVSLLCLSSTSKGLAAHKALGRVDIRKVLACSAIVNAPSTPRLPPLGFTTKTGTREAIARAALRICSSLREDPTKNATSHSSAAFRKACVSRGVTAHPILVAA